MRYLLQKDICLEKYWAKFLIPSRRIQTSRTSSSSNDLLVAHTIYKPSGKGKEKPPLLITHGLLGSKFNWNTIAKAVSKATHRAVVCFDARNHGESPHSKEMNYQSMAEDVLVLIKHLGIEKCSLMGHSMGGRTAVAFGLNHPELLEKLIVVDVSPFTTSSDFSSMKQYLSHLANINFDQKDMTLSEARKKANDMLMSIVQEASIRAFLLTNLAEKTGEIIWRPNIPILLKNIQMITQFPQHLLEKKCTKPVLVIKGSKSSYVPDSELEKFKKIFPHVQMHTVQRAGHWPHADNARDFISAVVAFLG